jgi:hypothetical protein
MNIDLTGRTGIYGEMGFFAIEDRRLGDDLPDQRHERGLGLISAAQH